VSRVPSMVQQGPFGTVNNAGRRRARPQPIVLLRGIAQGLEHTHDRGLDAVQQNIRKSTATAKAFPLADCNFLYGLTFVANVPQTVAHGLGRAFVSATLCGASALGTFAILRPSVVQRPPTPQNHIDQHLITIIASFNGVADLLVW
jgi:hypothetical protein